jgi:hypothetical protein
MLVIFRQKFLYTCENKFYLYIYNIMAPKKSSSKKVRCPLGSRRVNKNCRATQKACRKGTRRNKKTGTCSKK